MSMNTPIGNITQTTPIKDFKELDEMQNEQYLLGIDNNAVGNGSKISLENLINSSISADNNNLITKGTDDKLLVNTPIEIGDLSSLTTTNKSTLVAAINEVDSDITAEATTRQNADNNLQSQIDAITAASDVTDIVGTYAQLQAYDTTGLPDNSIIKVLQDESRQDETTYYRWVITGGVGAWVLIGEEGPYYTISQSDSKFATQATVGNLSNLATFDKSSVVNAMNELASVLDPTQTADYIKNSKAIYSGEVSENALILPQIKEMAHSTFDLSKFTVVGSPNITDDGIASGFTTSNYLTTKDFIIGQLSGKSWTIHNKFYADLNEVSSYPYGVNDIINLSESYHSYGYMGMADSKSRIMITTGTTGSEQNYYNEYAFSQSGWVEQELSFDVNTGTYTFKHLVPGDSNWHVTTWVATSENKELLRINVASTDKIRIGRGSDAIIGYGSIDLKQFSITVDGVEVFSGNKTGIDTIKPDDYTVVGTPAISADGIASGFTTSNYLYSKPFTLGNKSWEIQCKFKTEEVLTGTPRVIMAMKNSLTNWYMDLGIWFGTADWFSIRVAVDNNGEKVMHLKNIQAQPSTDYTVRIVFTGTQYVYYVNGEVVETFNDTNLSVYAQENSVMQLGGYHDSGHNVPGFLGSIDLNAFKIYVDGNLVYQPCLKIPYTESKTGSKIVGVNYRERVTDMAEQFGYAPYYTLSDTDFTLPQGEIYGYLEKRARDIAHPVAQPFYRFSDEINDDEVRLEGAEVDKGLYLAIENDPYLSALCTAGSTADKICLPDFRGRVIYGDVASGYVSPELPNITGSAQFGSISSVSYPTAITGADGAFYGSGSTSVANVGINKIDGYNNNFNFNASRSSSIYKDGGTVKTAGVKVRWLCRWK